MTIAQQIPCQITGSDDILYQNQNSHLDHASCIFHLCTFLWPVAEVTSLQFDSNLDSMMFNHPKPPGSLFMYVRMSLERCWKKWRIKFLLAGKIAPQERPPRRSSNCFFSNIAFRSNLSATLTLYAVFLLKTVQCLRMVLAGNFVLVFYRIVQNLVPWWRWILYCWTFVPTLPPLWHVTLKGAVPHWTQLKNVTLKVGAFFTSKEAQLTATVFLFVFDMMNVFVFHMYFLYIFMAVFDIWHSKLVGFYI